MKKGITVVALLLAALLFMADDGCDNSPTADEQQHAQQEKMVEESNRQIGMPGVSNFTEKKLVRHLYELRDSEIATFAYVMDMNGHLWHICDSIGYGLPYAVQFSNPQARYWDNAGHYELPQPEPNGLFMPSGAEGTWIICAANHQTRPVYVEPRVVVSPFRLQAYGEWAAK